MYPDGYLCPAASLAKSKKNKLEIKRFNIKNDFAPVVNQAMKSAHVADPDAVFSDEIRKEYNIRSNDSFVASTMIKATVIADAAGLSDEQAAGYLDEVYVAAAAASDEKNRSMKDKQFKNSGDALSAVDKAVYDLPSAPEGFGKSLIVRYRDLVRSGKVTDNFIKE
jgi:hypothetical protein